MTAKKVGYENILHNLFKLELQGILERLAEGPVIGDGGFIFELEKRGGAFLVLSCIISSI